MSLSDVAADCVFLGAALLAALLASTALSRLKIPHVTAYVLVGVLLGPDWLGLISADRTAVFPVAQAFGLGLILFAVGGVFKEELLRLGRKIILLALFDAVFTFFTVFAAVRFGGAPLTFSLFLSVMAIATAPASTLLVLMEYRSRGPVTDHILALLTLNNVTCIIGFQVMLIAYQHIGAGWTAVAAAGELGTFLLMLFASIAAGVFFGLGYAYIETKERTHAELVVLLFGAIALQVGVCRTLGLYTYISTIFMGMTVMNLSYRHGAILNDIRDFGLPFFIIFFLLAGSKFHIQEFLHLGAIGGLYVAGRCVGRLAGVFAGAKATRSDADIGKFVGLGMLTQVDLVIALSSELMAKYPAVGSPVYTVLLGSVMFFELLGPIFTRAAVVAAGEVRVKVLLTHPGRTKYERDSVRLIKTALRKLGFWNPTVQATDPSQVRVGDVCRKNFTAIPAKTPFLEMLKRIEVSGYDHFPIVDANNHFRGMVTYRDIGNIVADPVLAKLLVAEDLIQLASPVVQDQDTLDKALRIMEASGASWLPVLSSQEPNKIVGMLEHRDVIAIHGEFLGAGEKRHAD